MTYDQLVHTVLGGLAIGCIYSLIALGISMIIRATDILNFAQGEMMMIGAMAGSRPTGSTLCRSRSCCCSG